MITPEHHPLATVTGGLVRSLARMDPRPIALKPVVESSAEGNVHISDSSLHDTELACAVVSRGPHGSLGDLVHGVMVPVSWIEKMETDFQSLLSVQGV